MVNGLRAAEGGSRRAAPPARVADAMDRAIPLDVAIRRTVRHAGRAHGVIPLPPSSGYPSAHPARRAAACVPRRRPIDTRTRPSLLRGGTSVAKTFGGLSQRNCGRKVSKLKTSRRGSRIFFSVVRAEITGCTMKFCPSIEPAAGERLNPAGPTGLEPAISGVTGRRSKRLNYDPALGLLCPPLFSSRLRDVDYRRGWAECGDDSDRGVPHDHLPVQPPKEVQLALESL